MNYLSTGSGLLHVEEDSLPFPDVLHRKKRPADRGRSRGTLVDSSNLSDKIMRCDHLISSISLALEV